MNPARRIAVVRGSGRFVIRDMQQALVQLPRRAGFRPGFAVIWDLRDCAELDISLMDIISLPREIVELADRASPGGRTGWVAPTAFAESVIRILYQNHPWTSEWRTFTTLESAMVWCTSGPQAPADTERPKVSR